MSKIYHNQYNNIIKAIKYEQKRAELAERGLFLRLRKLYTKSLPEIKNINNSKFWDKKNANCQDYVPKKHPMAVDRVKRVVKLINGQNITILNIGVGSGSLEREYFNKTTYSRGITWHGIDIAKKSILQARNNFPNCSFEVVDIEKNKLEKNKFDYIVALEVLEHIKPVNLFGVINVIYNALKRRGKFILSVPLNEGLEAMLLNGKNPNGHVRIYTPKLIKAELMLSGFDIIDEQYLYAFRNKYLIKNILITFLKFLKTPNGIIIVARKP